MMLSSSSLLQKAAFFYSSKYAILLLAMINLACPTDTSPHEELHGKIPKLREADIVLIRHKKNVFRFFLRKITNSYWDHTSLVMYPQKRSEGVCSTIIIESVRRGFIHQFIKRGVSLHKLEKYINRPDKFEIGIKRVPRLNTAKRKRVVQYMLMNIDAPYWSWRYFYAGLVYFIKPLREKYLATQRFSCSGLIQTAFFDIADWKEKDKVIFKPHVWSPVELQTLTTPADIAYSANTTWVYNEK